VPAEISDDIAELTAGTRHGFGSVRGAVTVGSTTWQNSVFPDSKTGAYLLAVKKSIRTAEDLAVGADVNPCLNSPTSNDNPGRRCLSARGCSRSRSTTGCEVLMPLGER
jgi:hypothetical protein